MSDRAILFALAAMVSMVAPLSGQDCSSSSVKQCLKAFDSLKAYRSYLVLDDVLPAWNKSEVQQLCLSYKQFSVCMKTVISHCGLSDQLHHEGLNDAYEYLCTNSTITEYLTYHECFGDSAVRRRVHFCNETFKTKTSTLSTWTASSEKRRQYCQYYDHYVDCVEAAVQPVCGDDASDWQSQYVAMLHQPALDYIGCTDGNSGGSGWSAVTIIISVFIVLTIFLMLVVIVVFLVVVRRRRSLAGGGPRHGRRHHRRRTSTPPDYDAPYVVYAAAGPDGERRLQVVGLDADGQPTVVDASTVPVFKGAFVRPPPYVDESTPAAFAAVDRTPDTDQSADHVAGQSAGQSAGQAAGENEGFEEESTSPSGQDDTSSTMTDAPDLPPSSDSE